jgi:hypothetical protein
MRNPANPPNSRSGAMIAHPSRMSRCHNGRGLRSAGIAPMRNTIAMLTQSKPTAVSGLV